MEVEALIIVYYLSKGPGSLEPARVEPSPPSIFQEGGLHLIHPSDSPREDGLELKQHRGEHEEPFPQKQL